MKKIYLIYLLLSICLLAVSCTLVEENQGSARSIEGIEWKLKYFRKSAALQDPPSTLIFKDGVVSGSAGCNQYSGSYKLNVNKNRIEISQLQSTLMACQDPAGLMDQEAVFIDLLSRAYRFEINADILMIFDEGHEALTFNKVE